MSMCVLKRWRNFTVGHSKTHTLAGWRYIKDPLGDMGRTVKARADRIGPAETEETRLWSGGEYAWPCLRDDEPCCDRPPRCWMAEQHRETTIPPRPHPTPYPSLHLLHPALA